MNDEKWVLEKTKGGIWHTTTHERFRNIIRAGLVLVEPDLPDSERWNTANGPPGFPFVRHIGGISLFDFRDFDPAAYSETYPVSCWSEFVPFRSAVGHAVWMDFSNVISDEKFVDKSNLIRMWNDDRGYRHNILPNLEAAYLGDLDLNKCNNIFYIGGRPNA